MSQAISFLFSVTGVVALFFVEAMAVIFAPRSKYARTCLIGTAAFYLAASIYAVPGTVSRVLTSSYHRFERADVPGGRIALVIFGAGDEVVEGWTERTYVSNPVAVSRVLEAYRVYRLAQPNWIISSGGTASPDEPAEVSSRNMRDMLVRLGVPPDRILLESTSRNSHEEAVLVAPMVRNLGADAVILVTSAVHMRRSMGAFHAVGMNPTPAIAPDSWFQNGWRDWLLPAGHGLNYSGEIAHELVGILYYRIRGWWK